MIEYYCVWWVDGGGKPEDFIMGIYTSYEDAEDHLDYVRTLDGDGLSYITEEIMPEGQQ